MRAISRSPERELLDASDADPIELGRNLAEMAMLNRLPGGVGSSVRAVLAVLALLGPMERGSVLDVGTGSGDFARRLRRRSTVPLMLVDHSPDVLDITRRNMAGMDDVTIVLADAVSLPLPARSVAVAHASLLLHHLDPDAAVSAFREMRRVATRGVVVNDLRRSRLAYVMTAAPVLAFGRSCYTRHDGLLSVRRAYTVGELDDLAAEAGLRPTARTTAWWPRVTTTYQ